MPVESKEVFISYAHDDYDAVLEVVDKLKEKGCDVWFDEDEIGGGGDWMQYMSDAVNSCKSCAVFFGDKEPETWHAEEMKLALNRKVNDKKKEFLVIPVLLDLLAAWETREAKEAGGIPDTAEERRREARRIREEFIRVLPRKAETEELEWIKGEWWYYSTVGEAYFGLRRYEEATEWLVERRPHGTSTPDWEYESTARRIAWIARVQSEVEIDDPAFTKTEAWAVLQKFLGDDATAVRSAFVGKVGLSFSGGGFRASLFHIGCRRASRSWTRCATSRCSLASRAARS